MLAAVGQQEAAAQFQADAAGAAPFGRRRGRLKHGGGSRRGSVGNEPLA